jgi:hypothetical protein
MKLIIFIAALFCLALATAQTSIQIHGQFLFAKSDTITITIYSDGETISRKSITDEFYSLILGAKPHYTIKFESGSRVKYCHLITYQMGIESIAIDIDFKTPQSAIIYKKKKGANYYDALHYGSGRFRNEEIQKIEAAY